MFMKSTYKFIGPAEVLKLVDDLKGLIKVTNDLGLEGQKITKVRVQSGKSVIFEIESEEVHDG